MTEKDLGQIIPDILATATVDNKVGEPAVNVTVEQINEVNRLERKFNFEFVNMKGEKGDTPVKGVDYLTEEEKQQFTTETLSLVTAEGAKQVKAVTDKASEQISKVSSQGNDQISLVSAEGQKVVEQVKKLIGVNPAGGDAVSVGGKTRVEFEKDTQALAGKYNGNFPLTSAVKNAVYLVPTTGKFYVCNETYNSKSLNEPNENFEELSVFKIREKNSNLNTELNKGFSIIEEELCIQKILPPSPDQGKNIDLSDSKVGYFYWNGENKVSWNNSDFGYKTKVVQVVEGEKYILKCTLNGEVPVYILTDKDFTTLSNINSAIQVFPKRQLSGNETFDETITIPKGVNFLSFCYRKNFEAKMTKFESPITPQQTKTLKERVVDCEKDISELKTTSPVKMTNDIVKYYLNNVVCVGDSLTAGYYHDGSKYLVAKENYPFYLKKILNCKIVDNYSESGYTSKDWYQKFSSKIQWANYDSVIIWLGTNGGLSDTIENDTANGFADTYTGHYCHIIDDAIKANPNIRIFLGTVFAVGGGSVSDKAGTNAVINKIATKYSSNVLGVVDNDNGELYLGENQNLYHPFHKFNGDMLHFGKVGNLHLAKHFIDEICKIIEKDESKMEVLFNELN